MAAEALYTQVRYYSLAWWMDQAFDPAVMLGMGTIVPILVAPDTGTAPLTS